MFAFTARAHPGWMDMMVACVVDVPPGMEMTHEHVRSALRSFRFTHPCIAARIAWSTTDLKEGRLMYESPASEEQVSSWIDDTLDHRDDLAETPGGINAAISALSTELSRGDANRTTEQFKAYHIPASAAAPQTHAIMLYLKHTLFDGIAAWETLSTFIHQLTESLGRSSDPSYEWGTEHVRLARAVHDRAAKPWSPADMHAEWPIAQRAKEVISRSDVSLAYLPTYQAISDVFFP